jgi:hypothetical protein
MVGTVEFEAGILHNESIYKRAITEKAFQDQKVPANVMGSAFQTQAEAGDFIQRRRECGGGRGLTRRGIAVNAPDRKKP